MAGVVEEGIAWSSEVDGMWTMVVLQVDGAERREGFYYSMGLHSQEELVLKQPGW